MRMRRVKNWIRYCLAFVLMSLILTSWMPYAVSAAEDYQVSEVKMQGTLKGTSALNVRSGPGKDYDIIGKADENSVLAIIGETDNGWYQIELDGKTGFVSANYVAAEILEEEVSADDGEKEELDPEEGEPETGYHGIHQSPQVIKIAICGLIVVLILIMIVLTVKGLRKEDDGDYDDEDDDDDDEDDDDDDDGDYDGGDDYDVGDYDGDDDEDVGDYDDDDDEEDADNYDDNDGNSKSRRRGENYVNRTKMEKRLMREANNSFVIREEDYRVQIDPSFFEDKEPIEQPPMATGYLERKKIEEEARKLEKRKKKGRPEGEKQNQAEKDKKNQTEDEKQKRLEDAMARLDELQKEIEQLKNE